MAFGQMQTVEMNGNAQFNGVENLLLGAGGRMDFVKPDYRSGWNAWQPTMAEQSTPPQSPEQPLASRPQGNEIMVSRLGNTVLSECATTEWHMYYRPNGRFTGWEARSNYRVAGTWVVEESNLCLSFRTPLSGVPNPSCQPVIPHQVGDTWSSNGGTVRLVQGIQ